MVKTNREQFDYDKRWYKAGLNDMKRLGPTSRHVRRLIKRLIAPLAFASILDVGCGQGSLLAELARIYPEAHVAGVDVSSSALDLARRKHPAGEFEALNVQEERLDARYDLVTCVEVLEHLPDDEAALANIARMTERYFLAVSVQGRMRAFERHVGHVRNYQPGELTNKIENAGFEVIQTIEWGFPFYSPMLRDVLETSDGKGTQGHYGPIRKLAAHALYGLFFLNATRRGDKIFVLACPTNR